MNELFRGQVRHAVGHLGRLEEAGTQEISSKTHVDANYRIFKMGSNLL